MAELEVGAYTYVAYRRIIIVLSAPGAVPSPSIAIMKNKPNMPKMVQNAWNFASFVLYIRPVISGNQ